ncbi:HECT domain [Phytophthora cactorum]|nr:HECT domain [Phytophthora cactorum]
MLVNGKPTIDVEELRSCTVFQGGYDEHTQVVLWLWQALREFTIELRGQFLKFMTGTNKIPLDGFEPPLNLTKSDLDPQALPRTHTCFNQLVLPEYTSYETLVEKHQLAEVDSLGKRKLLAIVNGARRATHVLLPCVTARLATATSLLLAAKSSTNLSTTGSDVDVHNATVRSQRSRPLEDCCLVLREQRRRQTLRDGVVLLNRLLKSLKLQRVQDRRKDFFLDDLSIVGDRNDCRLDEVAFAVDLLATGQNLSNKQGVAMRTHVNTPTNTDELTLPPWFLIESIPSSLGVVQRATQNTILQRVSNLHVLVRRHKTLKELIVNIFVEEETTERRAALAGCSHSREQRRSQRHLQIRVFVHDHGVVAAQLEDGLAKAGRDHLHRIAHFRAAPADQRSNSARVAVALQHVSDDLGARHRRERQRLGWLPDLRVTAHETQRGVPEQHRTREVEGRDDAHVALEGVVALHHEVTGTLGRDHRAVQRATESHSKITDVNGLLHLTDALIDSKETTKQASESSTTPYTTSNTAETRTST